MLQSRLITCRLDEPDRTLIPRFFRLCKDRYFSADVQVPAKINLFSFIGLNFSLDNNTILY